ncbi:hypothetical protein J7T55_014069 [Diaporthe amygdali]|uniref:uncharacterized protein n=1 Tax=Phomopsis amygdali TaxID=1214568 RepID=UPI0022FE16E5|nr:uncharacterized protein J7T55_014069 [Diaporthe amygdali]KAJ0100694.1 hypothetical protein J7T55_014069 [Diaporthe amygdali]
MEAEKIDQFSKFLTESQAESLRRINENWTFVAVTEQIMLAICPKYKSYNRKKQPQEKRSEWLQAKNTKGGVRQGLSLDRNGTSGMTIQLTMSSSLSVLTGSETDSRAIIGAKARPPILSTWMLPTLEQSAPPRRALRLETGHNTKTEAQSNSFFKDLF